MPFDGLRVLSLEGRRAAEIEKLICARGGAAEGVAAVVEGRQPVGVARLGSRRMCRCAIQWSISFANLHIGHLEVWIT